MYRVTIHNTTGSTITNWAGTDTSSITANEIRVRYTQDTCGVNQTTTNGNIDLVLPGSLDGIISGTGATTITSTEVSTGMTAQLDVLTPAGWLKLYDSNDDTGQSAQIVRTGYGITE